MFLSMLEKSLLQSRFLKFLIYVFVFLLLISFPLLLNYNEDSSFTPASVISSVLVNSSQVKSLYSQVKIPGIGRKPIECSSLNALIHVFVYDLPEEFHFGLLGWKGENGNVWPDVQNHKEVPRYPGGLNLQHSIEYWLTLDLLLSNRPGANTPCTAIRVMNSSQADVVFVPFFSSLSYNRHSKGRGREKGDENKVLQQKLVEFLKGRDEWKKRGGRDHIIVAHHPNSMLDVRRELASAMFVLADFGRYSTEVANVSKDIVAPYHHLVKAVNGSDSAGFEDRPILAFFQGALYRKDKGMIRQELYYLLKGENDIHFTSGSIEKGGIRAAGRGMRSSKFCLVIAGDTPSSNRLFDAIVTHCVPVIISDEIELPFEDFIDYSAFCLFVRASDSLKPGFLTSLLRRFSRDRWARLWDNLKIVSSHFHYHFPARPYDAVDMIWRAVHRRIRVGQTGSMNRARRLQFLKKKKNKKKRGNRGLW